MAVTIAEAVALYNVVHKDYWDIDEDDREVAKTVIARLMREASHG